MLTIHILPPIVPRINTKLVPLNVQRLRPSAEHQAASGARGCDFTVVSVPIASS